MKYAATFVFSALLSVGVKAIPHGWEHSSSVEPVPTTDCETTTWVSYEPTKPGHSAEVSTPVYHKSKIPDEYPPEGSETTPCEESGVTHTSVIHSTLTYEVSVTTTPGEHQPYTPTLTPVPYDYTHPASEYPTGPSHLPEEPYPTGPSHLPEEPYPTPTPEPYPPKEYPPVEYPPVEYPPTENHTAPPPYYPGAGGNTTEPTPPPYVPPYTGSANSGGLNAMVLGLVGMVALMGVL